LICSGFKIKVHPPSQKSIDKVVEPTPGASSSISPPIVSRKNKRKISLKTSMNELRTLQLVCKQVKDLLMHWVEVGILSLMHKKFISERVEG
jgi:hypothetical protein